MSAAARQPRFDPSGAPLSVLVDFDGTISQQDVGDELLARLVEDQAEVARQDQRYDEGRIGSRELIRWDMEVLPRDPEVLLAEISRLSLDPSFVELVDAVANVGGAIEIVSDGIGVHIEQMLTQLRLPDIPIATNVGTLGLGADGVSFPYGHPQCLVCGTCKRERVLIHQRADRVVIFVGDGTSDRYAAHHADIVFAKGSLAAWCDSEGIEYLRWHNLAEVAAWIDEGMSDGRLPRDAAAYRSRAAQTGAGAPAFICGPEVWGPGRTVAVMAYPDGVSAPGRPD